MESVVIRWTLFVALAILVVYVSYKFIKHLAASPEAKIYGLNFIVALIISVVRYFTTQMALYWMLAGIYLVANSIVYIRLFNKMPKDLTKRLAVDIGYMVYVVVLFYVADGIVDSLKYYVWP